MRAALPLLRLAVLASFLAGCAGGGGDAKGAADSANPSAATAAAPAAPSAASATPDARVTRADQARIAGRPDAPVWILVVSDFECPFCRQWERETGPQVRKEFVETGKARMAFLNFPLRQHANALPAAEAAMCAGAQDRFWDMQERIFAAQDTWNRLPDAAPHFEGIARELQLDLAAYRQCIGDQVMRPMIEADYRRAVGAGVESTPTFLISNMKLTGAQKIDVFRMTMQQALAGGMK